MSKFVLGVCLVFGLFNVVNAQQPMYVQYQNWPQQYQYAAPQATLQQPQLSQVMPQSQPVSKPDFVHYHYWVGMAQHQCQTYQPCQQPTYYVQPQQYQYTTPQTYYYVQPQRPWYCW